VAGLAKRLCRIENIQRSGTGVSRRQQAIIVGKKELRKNCLLALHEPICVQFLCRSDW
jgi:hypothetical protein